jgi:hypothetical protein
VSAGMADMITPADTAVVMLTPNSMQMENKKLPKKDCQNSSQRVRAVQAGSSGGRRSQCGMANPPKPKRSHASRKTGKAATSGFESAT